MKIRSYMLSGCLLLFWSVSFLVPFADILIPQNKPLENGEKQLSVEWLSLPVGLAELSDPLSGWKHFCRQELEVVSTSTELNPEFHPDGVGLVYTDSPGLERIQLFGVISEEQKPVYCFYDPMNNLWFNLSAGEKNDKIGIQLVERNEEDFPLLVDLENGSRFRIHERNWLLSPLAGTVDSTRESLE